MNIIFSKPAWDAYLYWQQTDKKVVARINVLIKEIIRNPYVGPGKPELLKHKLSGYWSRRIIGEHRIVYRVLKDHLLIYSLRYHYHR